MVKMMILFGLAGLGMECIATGVWDKKRFYMGYSTLLFAPLYALTPLIIAFVPSEWRWFQRASVYLVAIYGLELGANWLIKVYFGSHPSEVSYGNGKHFKRLINLEPTRIACWFIASIFLEWLAT